MSAREKCKTCAEKYGRDLWVGCCVCSGDVDPSYRCPGTLAPLPELAEKKIVEPEKPKKVKQTIAFPARRKGMRK